MKIIRAEEAGFCFGVKRAIDMVWDKSRKSSKRVSILKEIVHNRAVIKDFEEQDILSVPELADAQDGVLVVSAHGVPPDVIEHARQKGLEVLDATCPLVQKIHETVENLASQGYLILLLGDSSHDEVTGIQGFASDQIELIQSVDDLRKLKPLPEKVALVSQTTQSQTRFSEIMRELQLMHPAAVIRNTICDATEKRQDAMRQLARDTDLVYVVGSQNSANCNRLREIAREHDIPAFLIEDRTEIDPVLVRRYERIGVSAGASTPEALIDGVIVELEAIADQVNQQRKTTFAPERRNL
jgi:(E)-4-hydroxy-3-methyl-but-2-enyl pyrophosphate reductase